MTSEKAPRRATLIIKGREVIISEGDQLTIVTNGGPSTGKITSIIDHDSYYIIGLDDWIVIYSRDIIDIL